MEDNEAYHDLGPGLHVLREADPLRRAGSMAAQLRAELCATIPQVEATLADRSALPAIDVATLATLQVLSRRVARAERVAARTRARAVIEVSQRLAGTGSALAIHPATIRERASTVAAARAALVEAERALAAHRDELADAEVAEAAPGLARATTGEAPPDEARSSGADPPLAVRRSRSLGALLASFGLTLLTLGLGLLALWQALLFPLATSLWALRYLRPHGPEHDPDRAEAASLLAEVAASADELEARRASEARAEQTVLLEASRNRADEEVRIAERAWHDLAGPDDVADVEAVVQRFDPQHEDALLVANETAGVRATEVVLHEFRQRWLAFWQELGMTAPEPADGERAVDELAARVGRPIVLVGPAAARATDLARVAPAAPVVVVEGPGDGADALS